MRKWSLLLFFLMAGVTFVIAQPQGLGEDQLFFKRLSTEEGLPQSSVNDILKDSRGFVWIATEDGLCRFDGSEFITYRHLPEDTSSISHNVVHFIKEDSLGNLWVGTVSGLSYYNRAEERFHVYKTKKLPGVIYANGAIDNKRKRLWLACTVGGLQYLDITSQQVMEFRSDDIEDEIVWNVKLSGDSLFIGTLSGLKVLDLTSLQIKTLYSGSPVRAIWVEEDGVWIGTQGEGLIYFGKNGKNKIYNRANRFINNNDVWSLAKDSEGNLWIGTDGGGLNILNPQTGNTAAYSHSEFDHNTLSSNTIRSIFLEANGNSWLGTFNGGLCYREIPPVHFQLYRKEVFQKNRLRNNSVSAFAEAPNGMVWVGTDGGGLHQFDLRTKLMRPYSLPKPLGEINVITSLFCDDQGLWIGTFQKGLVYIDNKGHWKQYLNNPSYSKSISNNTVWSIQKDINGSIWLGTDRGLNKLDPASGDFHNISNPMTGQAEMLFRDLQVQTIKMTSDHTLWIGSYGTLTSYKAGSDSVMNIDFIQTGGRSVPDLRVKALLEDNGRLWIGTYGSGLCQYNLVDHSFRIIDERDGLPDNVVLSIERGNDNSLWLSTNKGLVYFSEPDSVFTLFDNGYGVQGAIFNRGASIKTGNGYLLFGGTSGLNVFQPDRVESKLPSIVYTDFKISNQRVKPGGGILQRSITETDKIELAYVDSRLLTIGFSAFAFLNANKVIYSYNLDGFSKRWQIIGNDHSVTFTNLDPGDYHLLVKASFNGRQWGPPKELILSIDTPWWLSIYFRGAVIGLFLLSGYGFYRYRVYNLREMKKRLEYLVKEQSNEINRQNLDLISQNEEFKAQNEELVTQREIITHQNTQLEEARQNLLKMNDSLEKLVFQRTEKLDQTILLLNKSIKELDAFVYSASHDLTAPLKSVMGIINLIRRENRQGDIATYVNHIETSVNKLEEVINTMVQYSQNSSLVLTKEDVNLHDLIQSCIDDLKYISGAEQVSFELCMSPNTMVVSDPIRLKIIFNNFISNAIKYKDPRKPLCMVKFTFEQSKTTWRLSVLDNGIGIDKQYLSRIFEMFYRATDRSKGSGLGLYIVKEAVQRLYGEVYVDSELGSWTKFTIAVPNEQIYVRKMS